MGATGRTDRASLLLAPGRGMAPDLFVDLAKLRLGVGDAAQDRSLAPDDSRFCPRLPHRRQVSLKWGEEAPAMPNSSTSMGAEHAGQIAFLP